MRYKALEDLRKPSKGLVEPLKALLLKGSTINPKLTEVCCAATYQLNTRKMFDAWCDLAKGLWAAATAAALEGRESP